MLVFFPLTTPHNVRTIHHQIIKIGTFYFLPCYLFLKFLSFYMRFLIFGHQLSSLLHYIFSCNTILYFFYFVHDLIAEPFTSIPIFYISRSADLLRFEYVLYILPNMVVKMRTLANQSCSQTFWVFVIGCRLTMSIVGCFFWLLLCFIKYTVRLRLRWNRLCHWICIILV